MNLILYFLFYKLRNFVLLLIKKICALINYFKVDLTGKQSYWKSLKPPAKDKCGELLTTLCYHPSNSILTLSLIKARNLKAKDINGKSGMYKEIFLKPFFFVSFEFFVCKL